MHVSIWEQGTREHVIQRLRSCDDTTPQFARLAREAMAQHLETHAAPDSPCTVSLSGSATYTRSDPSHGG